LLFLLLLSLEEFCCKAQGLWSWWSWSLSLTLNVVLVAQGRSIWFFSSCYCYSTYSKVFVGHVQSFLFQHVTRAFSLDCMYVHKAFLHGLHVQRELSPWIWRWLNKCPCVTKTHILINVWIVKSLFSTIKCNFKKI
jgi:hypothetical protein